MGPLRPPALLLASTLIAAACTSQAPSGPVASPSPSRDSLAPTTVPASPVAEVAWTAEIAPYADALVATRGLVYLTVDGILSVFRARCGVGGAVCRPLWSGDSGLFTVSGDSVYGTDYDRVNVYAARCRDDGGLCRPLFRTVPIDPLEGEAAAPHDVAIGRPLVANGMLYVSVGGSDRPEFASGRLYAFPALCRTDGGECPPLWKSPLLHGVWRPPDVMGGVVYLGSGSGLHVFREGCGTGGAVCQPVWAGDAGKIAGTVVSVHLAGGLVVLTASHSVYGIDGPKTRWVAFRDSCSTDVCEPVWSFAPGGVSAEPIISRGRIYIQHGGAALAFSLGCVGEGGTCGPVWRSRFVGSFLRRPDVPAGVAYLARRPGRLVAFPTLCPGRKECEGTWSLELRKFPWRFAQGKDGTVYFSATAFGSRKKLYAIPPDCWEGHGICEPVWTWPTGGLVNGLAVWRNLVLVATNSKLVALTAPA